MLGMNGNQHQDLDSLIKHDQSSHSHHDFKGKVCTQSHNFKRQTSYHECMCVCVSKIKMRMMDQCETK
jgi:hypothetical protein